MRALRFVLVSTGLVLCMCTAARGVETEGVSASARTDTDGTRSYHSLFERILNMVRSAEDGGGGGGGEVAQVTDNNKQSAHHPKKTKSGDQILEIFPRDLRKKEKFLKHLTGPLYFSPKCRKHVYRLYHNTRDCTIPAYYKRCARLLARLAGSPRCLES